MPHIRHEHCCENVDRCENVARCENVDCCENVDRCIVMMKEEIQWQI
jgi:hypothetical protein